MKKILSLTIVLIIAFLAGCNIPKAVQYAQISLAQANGPQAWIDAPLNHAVLPLAPYEIVFHITDQQEAVQGELSINNVVVTTLSNPNPGSKLATLKYAWHPAEPGEYVIGVRAQNASGVWSEVAESIVYIGELSPSPTSSITPSPTPSETPTFTPTVTPSYTPTIVGGFTNIGVSPAAVYTGNCSPNQVSFSAQAVDAKGITAVVVFYRLRDSGGSASQWLNASMNSKGGNQYSQSVNVASAASQLGLSNQNATLEYQLVIQNKAGEYVRSSVYNNVQALACGSAPQNLQIAPNTTPQFQIFPNNTPIVK